MLVKTLTNGSYKVPLCLLGKILQPSSTALWVPAGASLFSFASLEAWGIPGTQQVFGGQKLDK